MIVFAWVLLGLCAFEILLAPALMGKTRTYTASYVVGNVFLHAALVTFFILYLVGR